MKVSASVLGGLMAACLAMGGWALCAACANAGAPPGVERTVVLKKDSSIAGREGVVVSVVLAPGAAEGLHTHPADVYAYVIEGSATLELAGSPTATFHPGEAFYIPAGTVHQGINNGKVATRIVAVFVTEKGKPLTTPLRRP